MDGIASHWHVELGVRGLAVGLVLASVGYLVQRTRPRRHRRISAGAPSRAGALVLVVMLGGVWATVPDTESPLVALTVAAPGLVLAAVLERLPVWVLVVVTGCAAVAAAHGAAGRPGAVLGAACCLGGAVAGGATARLVGARHAVAAGVLVTAVGCAAGSRIVATAATPVAAVVTGIVLSAATAAVVAARRASPGPRQLSPPG